MQRVTSSVVIGLACAVVLVATVVVVWISWKNCRTAPTPDVTAPTVVSPLPRTRPETVATTFPAQDTTVQTAIAAASERSAFSAAPATTAAQDQEPFNKLFVSDTTKAVAKLSLSDEQRRALRTFEESIIPRLQVYKDAQAFSRTQYDALRRAYAASDQQAAQQLRVTAEAAKQAAWQVHLQIDELYYDGLKTILTDEQLKHIPVPGSIHYRGA